MNIRKSIHTVIFHNWFFSPYCFFLHELPKVHTVHFLSDPGSPSTVPRIPYPFLLPPSVQHLVIRGYSLTGHSVEGMLSPDMNLVTLELDAVDDSAMVCLYPSFLIISLSDLNQFSIYLPVLPRTRSQCGMLSSVLWDFSILTCIICLFPAFGICASICLLVPCILGILSSYPVMPKLYLARCFMYRHTVTLWLHSSCLFKISPSLFVVTWWPPSTLLSCGTCSLFLPLLWPTSSSLCSLWFCVTICVFLMFLIYIYTDAGFCSSVQGF